jgi:tripartite-type tricarboxylate transporter receptor subunit TctC
MKSGKWRILATLAGLAVCSAVAAQGSGNRPIRVLVPVAPGGSSDTTIRLIVPQLSKALHRSIVVDNRASANGVAGTEIAARANPDGLTFAIGNSGTHAINASLYRKLSYDPIKDFVPITEIITGGLVLVVNPALPANSLKDLVALARNQPGKLNIGVAGATGEIAGDALMVQAGIRLSNVRYKGSSPTQIAVLSGEVQMAMLAPLATIAYLKTGRLKAFGITSAQRSPVLPDLPTISELGVSGYDFQIWHGLFAPANTPANVVRAMHREVIRALRDPGVKEQFAKQGSVIIGSTPEEFAAVIKSEVAKYRKIITDNNLQID